MLRHKLVADLDPWIATATSLIASARMASPRTKMQSVPLSPRLGRTETEGQITKLKLVKRQTYGRAKIDLLQARLISAAKPRQVVLGFASEPTLEAD
jgi:hypothetical protein